MIDTLAYAVIQDLTYTARRHGQDISIEYVGGGTAGLETVTVGTNRDIVVTIEDTVSTADQVKAAIELNGDATALVASVVTGTGSNGQTTQGPTSLAGEVVPSTKDYYLDQTITALTGSFVAFPFGFHARTVIISNDMVSGTDLVQWSFGGQEIGGILEPGESITLDKLGNGTAVISLKCTGTPDYHMNVVGV